MFVVLLLLSQTRIGAADLPEQHDEQRRVGGESQSDQGHQEATQRPDGWDRQEYNVTFLWIKNK